MTTQTTQMVNEKALTLLLGNIVESEVDAIANAANSSLMGGGGVDGAIHRAAGPGILDECRLIGRCRTGNAVATSAGKLKARYIFHAVGPVYHGRDDDAQLLLSAYQRCLELADERHIKSLAFPSISTGIYGYPVNAAAPIALRTVKKHLQTATTLELVQFVLFDQRTYDAYVSALQDLSTQ
jgi:O-acetyl-ADP-ribose deacetylase